jgi:hypothetical protein
MKFDCSYSGYSGLTVSLSVSAARSFFAPSPEDEGSILADHNLASSIFEKSLPEIVRQLVSAHSEVERVLSGSLVSTLNEEVNILSGDHGQ